jgi:Ca2+-binding RTX toxin-like protein
MTLNIHVPGFGFEDVIDGTSGDDALDGTPNDDTINGFGGNDMLIGKGGSDTLYGGTGNDTLYANLSGFTLAHDVLYGGDGDDSLHAETGNEVYGGADFDTAELDFRQDTADLTADLTGLGSGATITVSNGTVLAGLESVLIDMAGGNDTVRVTDVAARLFGRDGDDKLIGGSFDDFLDGDAGLDKLYGGDGDDEMASNDSDVGDLMFGGRGNDVLTADAGDKVSGGAGIDSIEIPLLAVTDLRLKDIAMGTVAFDDGTVLSKLELLSVFFNSEDNTVRAYKFDSTIAGAGGNDRIIGGKGDDILSGNDGNDVLAGGKGGADNLDGGNGDDVLGGDADVLNGGDGVDLLEGSLGGQMAPAGYLSPDGDADLMVFNADFEDGATQFMYGVENGDTIDLSAIDADTTQAGDQAFEIVEEFSHTAGEARLTLDFFGFYPTVLELDVDGDAVADALLRFDEYLPSFDNWML